jgi:hypothetical protein
MPIAWLLLLSLGAVAEASVQANGKASRACVGGGDWTPSPKLLAALEAKLEPLLKLERQRKKAHGPGLLDEYLRHYVGVRRAGLKLIEVYAWHPAKSEDNACEPPGIKDGGCSVWRVTFDAKRGQLREFSCNGQA